MSPLATNPALQAGAAAWRTALAAATHTHTVRMGIGAATLSGGLGLGTHTVNVAVSPAVTGTSRSVTATMLAGTKPQAILTIVGTPALNAAGTVVTVQVRVEGVALAANIAQVVAAAAAVT